MLSARCIIYLTSVSQQLRDERDRSDPEHRSTLQQDGEPWSGRHQTFIFLYHTTFTPFRSFPVSVKFNDSKVLVSSTDVTIVKHERGEGQGETLIISLSGILESDRVSANSAFTFSSAFTVFVCLHCQTAKKTRAALCFNGQN